MKTLRKSKTLNDYSHRYRVAESGCWEWTGSLNAWGYGTQTVGSRTDNTKKTVLAHRLFYKLANGEFDEALRVLHKCDNPKCVNPSHLFLGTDKDNVDDMIRKGRKAILRGENHPQAKLTLDQVKYIRQRKLPRAELAQLMGVAKSTIKNIQIGRSWV
jgi:hypothetical protein